MFDINEIRKRAQQASEKASDSVKKTLEKSEELINEIEVPSSEENASISAAEMEEQIAANTGRQVEILGQIFGPDSMAQMAVNEEMIQKMVNDKVAEATASAAENFMGQLFGEDMGIIAAALESCCLVFYRPLTATIWRVWMWRNITLLWNRKLCPLFAVPGE